MLRSVCILMGSESDREIAKKAETVLEKFGVAFESTVKAAYAWERGD